METFLEVLNSCLTKQQVKVLRVALKQDAEVYFYGTGLGKSFLTEILVNAGYKVDEPGNQPGRRAHPNVI